MTDSAKKTCIMQLCNNEMNKKKEHFGTGANIKKRNDGLRYLPILSYQGEDYRVYFLCGSQSPR